MIKSKIIAVVAAFAMFAVAAGTSAAYMFNTNMGFGMRSNDVKELQLRLNSEVGTSLPGTTYFGSLTRTAVKSYQSMKGISPVSGYVGPLTRAALNGSTAPSTPSTPTQTGAVTAMLATTNPASSTLVAGQATANLAQFTFNGNGTVTNVTLQRIGVSADSTLSNVYLFDGANRLTDAATVSNNGMVTFSNGAGLFMVSGSKTITVRSDIAGSTSGQTVGVKLVSFMTSGASSATTANVSANLHSIATATLASVSAGTVTPSGATINPGSNVTVWQSTLNISQRDVMMKRFAVRQVGSAPANAFANFKLYVNGVQVATSTGMDMMGYVTFDMTNAPVTLTSGSRIVRVDADVLSGASRTVSFSVRQAADVDFTDSSYGVNITPTSTPWVAGSASTIGGTSGGTVTVEKDTSSPTQPVSVGTNDVKLGTFKVTAYGEAVKIETLRASVTASDGTIGSLRNGRITINGTQYGSTATLNEDSQGTPYTSYTTNYVVYPGTPVLVDVYADMYDNDGTNGVSNGDTFTVNLEAGSSNASKQDSLGYINVPGAQVVANTITANSASVTLAKSNTYPNQTVAVPQTSGYMIGKWNVSGSSVEDVLLTTASFDLTNVAVSANDFTYADLTNLKMVVKDGSGNTVAAPSPLGTTSATGNSFSFNYTLPKNGSATIELWANIGSSITSAEKLKSTLTLTGTASVSGTAVAPSATDGQTMTAGTGTITATKAATTADARIVADNQTIDVADFRFEGLYSDYTVTDITFTIADVSAVSTVMLYDGATFVASKTAAATTTFNGLTWKVNNGAPKNLTVKLVLGTVGNGAGSTGASLLTTLTSFTATSSATGVSDVSANDSGPSIENDPASNATYVYAAIPTITSVNLPTTQLGPGTVTAAKFTVGSNGTGTIGWKKLIFTINRAMSGTDTLGAATLWDADTNTQIAGTATYTGSIDQDSDTSGGLTFVATNEQQISGSKTYALKISSVACSCVAGDNLNVSIAQPDSFAASTDYTTVAAANSSQATFVWSDTSAASHSTSTSDWTNAYLVKNLPTDSQTLKL